MTSPEPAAPSAIDLEVGPLLRPVLARVIGAFASRADLPVDRVLDARLLGEALAAHAPRHLRDGRLAMTIELAPRRLVLRLGPIDAGAGDRLLSDSVIPEVGPIIQRLADAVAVEVAAGAEMLVIEMTAPG